MDSLPQDPYDELPYNAKAIPQGHPSRLAAVARLFGFQAPDPTRCRLLDVGCADGAHLLPLAIEFPNSEFVGLDISAEHAARGRRAVEALGLKNLEIRCVDFSKDDQGPRGFDFVIAHGLYSWVPPEVRSSLLRSMRAWLGASGVGYVSYNTYPGGHLKNAVRQLGFDLVGGAESGVSNVPKWRALAEQLAEAMGSTHALSGGLKKELTTVASASDSLIAHDWFGRVSEPVSFLAFAEQLAVEGLQYLCEAELSRSPLPHLSPAGRRVLAEYGSSRLRREACLDVLTCNGFRQSLVVATEATLPATEDRTALRTLWLTSNSRVEGTPDLREGVPVAFVNRSGTRIQLSNFWVKSALCELGAAYPEAIHFEQVAERAFRSTINSPQLEVGSSVLQDALFELSLLGFVDLRAQPAICTSKVGERPEANPCARWQASLGSTLTNQHHVPVTIEERSIRLLIPLLDGTRERATVLEGWRAACAEHGLLTPTPADLESALERLVKFALLVA